MGGSGVRCGEMPGTPPVVAAMVSLPSMIFSTDGFPPHIYLKAMGGRGFAHGDNAR